MPSYSLRLSAILCLILLTVFAQGQSLQDTVGLRKECVTQARYFFESGFKGDVNQTIKYYHPEIIKLAGGEAAFLQELKEGAKFAKKSKLPVLTFHADLPEILVIDESTIQCVFSYWLKSAEAPAMEAYQSSLIGIYNPTLRQWYFIDKKDREIEDLRSIYPFISARLGLKEEVQALNTDSSAIPWKIPPFLEASEILAFNPNKGRVVYGLPIESIENGGGVGLITTDNKKLIQPRFFWIEDQDSLLLIDQRSIIYDGKWNNLEERPEHIVNKDLSQVYKTESKDSGLKYTWIGDDKYRISTLNGEFIMELKADEPPRLAKGFIVYKRNFKMGVYSRKGKELIPPKYNRIEPFSNGFSTLAKLEREDNGLIIDTLGNVLYTPKGEGVHLEMPDVFLRATSHFVLKRDSSYLTYHGLVDPHGKVVAEPDLQYISLSEKYYTYNKGRKWYMNTIKGNQPVLGGKAFDNIDFEGKYISTCDGENKVTTVFNEDLEQILSIPGNCRVVMIITFNKEPMLNISFEGGEHFFHLDGKPVEIHLDYHHWIDLGFVIEKNNKFGLADFNEKLIIPVELDEIKYLEESQSLWGRINGKWGLLKY